MTKGNFVIVRKNCGKRRTQINAVIQGTIPPKRLNVPHNPEWIKL